MSTEKKPKSDVAIFAAKLSPARKDDELTFGEKAAGVTFNPSMNEDVDVVKAQFANCIDTLHALRLKEASNEAKRYYSKAISYAEDAQMNAVKAITWQHS